MVDDLQQFAKTKEWRAQVADFIDTFVAHLALLPTAYLTGAKTYDPPNIPDVSQTSTTVTVTGAALGNVALAAFSLDLLGMVISAYVSSANTVTVTIRNDTGADHNLGSGTLRASVVQ